MFWKNWSWSARILAVLTVGLVAVVLYPVFFRARETGGRRNGCQTNLKQLGLGFLQYTQDYDEKLPLVATGHSAYGWADAIYPYVKSTQLYQCPLEPMVGQRNPRKIGYTDFPFNRGMSGKSLEKLPEPNSQILSLDGNYKGDVTDSRYSFAQIPPNWRQNQDSPLYRHSGKANYLFADGHVKALPFSQLEADKRAVF